MKTSSHLHLRSTFRLDLQQPSGCHCSHHDCHSESLSKHNHARVGSRENAKGLVCREASLWVQVFISAVVLGV